MSATNLRHPSSAAHDDPLAAMTWHRRRIRRARRNRESAPQPIARVAQSPDGGKALTDTRGAQAQEAGRPLIRRLVVFVPRRARAGGAVVRPVEPVAAPGPA